MKSNKIKSSSTIAYRNKNGFNGGRIYTIDPTNLQHIKEYEKEFYTDDVATVSACRQAQQ